MNTPPIVVFLFGSGISCGAGIPGVSALTQTVLASDNPKMQSFLAILKQKADAHYGFFKSNYEDVYYLSEQINCHLLAEYENPALIPFVRSLASELKCSHDDVQELAAIATEHIVNKVSLELTSSSKIATDLRNASPYNGLQIALEGHSIIPHIYTLNHDLLFEMHVGSQLTQWVTGFTIVNGQPESWRPKVDESPAKPRFYKLHGSIDWWRTRPLKDRMVASNDDANAGSTKDPWRNEQIVRSKIPADWEKKGEGPVILAGTFNKLLDYSKPCFLWMLGQFLESLMRTNRLIVCGYGFADKGINNQIIDWLYQRRENRMIVADLDPFAKARGAIVGKVDSWKTQSVLSIIKTPFEIQNEPLWNEIMNMAAK